ncbi:prepilin peptidase [Pseudaestuariivita sp.]|uniref:prepilin peptidase n=1 Tax=Pseudaestuariivita sp. TaxID=2211669 RepID=UPI00405A4A55
MGQGLWLFLPFVAPICLYVAFTDVKQMKIKNHAVLALLAVFALVGPLALPLDVYAWRWLHVLVLFGLGFALTSLGAMGAGDAKFLAAAAPFVAAADVWFAMLVLAAAMVAAITVHRGVRASPLRRLAPDWASWTDPKFPMGLALGPALTAYLVLSIVQNRPL